MNSFIKTIIAYSTLVALYIGLSWLFFGDFRHAHEFAGYMALFFVLEHKFEAPQS
jgi:hypothetical protein